MLFQSTLAHVFSITRLRSVLFLSGLFLFVAGCSQGDKEVFSSDTIPAELADQYFPANGNLAGSHILIQYKGAQNAAANVERTAEEAKSKAQDLLNRILANPSLFAELAAGNSDGPSGPTGGDLGSWQLGSMAFAFDSAMVRLKEGQIGPNVVETPFGFHVIKRNINKSLFYSSYGFAIAFQGPQTPPNITRTREEAAAISIEVAQKMSPETFFDLAEQYGDGPVKVQRFPPFAANSTQVPPQILEALKETDFDQVAGPFELPNGFIFFLRTKTEKVAANHILARFEGVAGTEYPVKTTRAQAKARIDSLSAILQNNPEKFEELALTSSDSPTSGSGGQLGVWLRGGAIDPEFDRVMDELEINEIEYTPIESQFGFHILKRVSVPVGS